MIVDPRLGPERPHPAGRDDVMAVYCALLRTVDAVPPRRADRPTR